MRRSHHRAVGIAQQHGQAIGGERRTHHAAAAGVTRVGLGIERAARCVDDGGAVHLAQPQGVGGQSPRLVQTPAILFLVFGFVVFVGCVFVRGVCFFVCAAVVCGGVG